MKIYDISWPITADMTTYKDKGGITVEPLKIFETDKVRETKMCLTSHTGTHVDAPSHFLQDGHTIDQYSFDRLCGPCVVVDMTHVTEKITADDLRDLPSVQDKMLLFKTRNSGRSATAPFDYSFVYVDHTAAQFLAEQKIGAIGIDYLGIERNQPAHQTHSIFLSAGIPIIEGLRLEMVIPDNYWCVCLPLNIIKIDGAPARVILMSEKPSI